MRIRPLIERHGIVDDVTDFPTQQRRLRIWRKRVFVTLWMGYFSYYLCRHNIAVGLPGTMAEFGATKADAGLLGSAMSVVYALGQFINGQLGDRFGARALVTVGLIGSALLNVAFGFGGSLAMLLAIWALNGYFQSAGWSPSIRALAHWFPVRRRGVASGLFATCCGVGTVASWLLSAWLADRFNWRYAFWVPGGLCVLAGVGFWLICRNSPADVALPPVHSDGESHSSGPGRGPAGFRHTLRQTIGSFTVWRVGLAYLGLSMVSYGFLFWAPTYASEVCGVSVANAALRVIMLPLAASLGGLAACWATDRWLNSRRAPVLVAMAVLAAAILLAFPYVASEDYVTGFLAFAAVGFFAGGAHVTLVSLVPMDVGGTTASSSVAGFVDSLGYVGAAVATVGAGWIVDRWGWNMAFPFWAGGALFAAALLATLWPHGPAGLAPEADAAP